MSKHHVSSVINGEPVEFLCEPQQTLLDCLRDELHLTGSKEGCGSGDCGACTVIVDGNIVCSCLMLGVEAEGRTVLTVEGVAEGEKLHPVQQKFLEHAALQCGFCTPGFIVAAKALLDENKNPTSCAVRTRHRPPLDAEGPSPAPREREGPVVKRREGEGVSDPKNPHPVSGFALSYPLPQCGRGTFAGFEGVSA